jgi:hypothetical protein
LQKQIDAYKNLINIIVQNNFNTTIEKEIKLQK